MSTTFKFPEYRKYPNNKHFFRIISLTEFEEISIMGTHYSIHHKIASILPDRNFILDMLNYHEGHFMESSEGEYEAILLYCGETLTKF
jgi:hypothetical protein